MKSEPIPVERRRKRTAYVCNLLSYLFRWDDIPGNDNGRLIGFLKKRFGIEWVENAKIEKIDDGKTIRLSFENNFLSLKLSDDKTKVRLKIDDGRADKFITKTENGKLNIYRGSTDDKSGWISVIDLESRTLTKNIKVGKFPVFSLVYPHDRRKLIVTLHNYTLTEGGGSLELVDLQTGKVIQEEPYPDIAVPTGMVYDGKREALYVADENEPYGYVHVHDGKTLKLLYSLPAGRATAHMDISSDGRHLVATNRHSANLSVFDLEKNPVTAQNAIPLGDPNTCHPYDVKFSGNPDICYVTDFKTGELLVVDIAGRIITDRIKVGEWLFGMALDKVGTTAYVCDLKSNSVFMVDIGSKKVDKITLPEGKSSHCAMDEKGHLLVVSCHGDPADGPSSVHIIDLIRKTAVATIVDEKLLVSFGVTIEA